MRKISGWLLLLVVSYLVALLAFMPARFAFNNIAPKLGIEMDKAWTFDAVSGRLWNGQITGLAYQGTAIGHVDWELGFFRLLIGDVALHWRAKTKNGALDGDMVMDSSGVLSVRDIQGDISASELLQFIPYAVVPLTGTISTNISEVQVEENRIKSIEGQLLVQSAETLYPEKITFGDIKIDAKTQSDDGLIVADISNSDGDIAINSSATLNSSGQYQIKGSLEPVNEPATRLIKMISMFGAIERSGKLRINRSGQLYK